MMRFYRHALALVAAIIALSGCIRENIDDCETPVEVDFLYYGNGDVDIFPDRVDSVLMYVYRLSTNSIEETIRLHKSDLLERQGVKLRLTPGDYRLVCWGNAGQESHITLSEGGNGRIMSLDHHEGRAPTGIEELYYGCIDLNVPLTLRPVKEEMVYRASYITMLVELLGFADIGSVSLQPSVRSAVSHNGSSGISADGSGADAKPCMVGMAHGKHSAYIDFDHVPAADELIAYVPDVAIHPSEADSYILNYLVPRFDNGTGATIEVIRTDTGKTLYSKPLAELMDMLDIVIDDRNEQTVHIRLRAQISLNDVVVNVVGWDDETVYPGFD